MNATARLTMYQQFKKIPQQDLIYTDTDSIKFTGNHKSKFDIGEGLGQFKVEHENTPMKIYGKKTYSIGEQIKVSGIHSKNLNKKDFDNGVIKGQEMNTINTTTNIDEVGKFRETTRDLNKQQEEYEQTKVLLEENKLYIDQDITDITYFLKTIS